MVLNSGAEWYRDPARRAEYRYWDGTAWSQWVADAGVSRADDQPLPPGLPPPPPLPPPGFPPPSAVGTHASPYAPAAGAALRPRYASLRGLWVSLAWLLGIEALVALVLVGTVVNRIVKLDAFDNSPSIAAANDYHDADRAVGSAQAWMTIFGIAIFVLLVIYLFRASRNTALWRSDRQTWAAGWTIGAWFIPLANALIPCMVMCEIWNRSAPIAADGTPAPKHSAPVVWCWVIFVVGLVAASLDYSPESVSEARIQDWFNLAGAVLLGAAAVLFVFLLRSLTRRQEELVAAKPS